MKLVWSINVPTTKSAKDNAYVDIGMTIILCAAVFFVSLGVLDKKYQIDSALHSFNNSNEIFRYPTEKFIPPTHESDDTELLLNTVEKKVNSGPSLPPTSSISTTHPLKKTIYIRKKTSPIIPEKTESPAEEEFTTKPEKAEDYLSKIRTDKDRVYVEKPFVWEEIQWGVRNVSPMYGIEVWIENQGETGETYYLPQISIDGNKSKMESLILAPGAKIYGYVEYPYVRRKTEVTAILKIAGKKEIKQRLKIPW